MKILIVEDEEILMKVLREKFEKEGFDIKMVTDGEAVLPALKKSRPDMVLLDLILPKKDGIEVLSDLKKNPEFQNIPVMVLSNLGDDEKIKEALKLGAVDYLVKTQHPINEVVDKVSSYLIVPKTKLKIKSI